MSVYKCESANNDTVAISLSKFVYVGVYVCVCTCVHVCEYTCVLLLMLKGHKKFFRIHFPYNYSVKLQVVILTREFSWISCTKIK